MICFPGLLSAMIRFSLLHAVGSGELMSNARGITFGFCADHVRIMCIMSAVVRDKQFVHCCTQSAVAS